MPGLERSVSASSGVTVPFERLSHSLRGVRPRARMSSENEVSIAKFFSTRAAHEVARALPAHQQSFAHQAVDGLAHGDARDRELGGQIALRRQRVVGAEHAPVDGLAQRALQLLVERQIARPFERTEGLRENVKAISLCS